MIEPTMETSAEFTTADLSRLAVRDWAADGTLHGTPSNRKPLVLIVHGLGEHAERYQPLAARLAAAGYPVRAYDHYGHGRSSGPRGGMARDLQLVDHLAELAAATMALPQHAGRGLVLVGHSLGGLIVASAVMRGLVSPTLLVMSSPALAVRMAAWQRAAVGILPRFLPSLTLGNGLDPQILSHDRKVVEEYLADPLVHDRICARLGGFVFNEGVAVRAAAARWTTPTLLLYAGDDRAVDPQGSREFAAAAPPSAVRAQCFAAMYHEIFNEPDASAVTALETALAGVA
jgi:alpha-beta hydrolase superfamily lysophospholipase